MCSSFGVESNERVRAVCSVDRLSRENKQNSDAIACIERIARVCVTVCRDLLRDGFNQFLGLPILGAVDLIFSSETVAQRIEPHGDDRGERGEFVESTERIDGKKGRKKRGRKEGKTCVCL